MESLERGWAGLVHGSCIGGQCDSGTSSFAPLVRLVRGLPRTTNTRVAITRQPFCKNDLIKLDFDAYLREYSLDFLLNRWGSLRFAQLFARSISKLNDKKTSYVMNEADDE